MTKYLMIITIEAESDVEAGQLAMNLAKDVPEVVGYECFPEECREEYGWVWLGES